MLETGLAQLRFAVSLVLGTRLSLRSLDRLIHSLQQTRHEFGGLSAEGRDLLAGPVLDEETRQAMQLRRFRSQAVRAARETTYYRRLFERLGLDPGRLRYEEIAALLLTPKADLRADPEAFVCRNARPYLRCLTTGTTGWPTSVSFSSYEMRVYFALAAISALFRGELEAEDIVQISTSSRGTLGNVCLAGACAHLGTLVYLVGVTEPSLALGLLARKYHVADKKPQTSVLHTYPSYLGELVEAGLRLGYRPGDFGLERIYVGGEVVTEGLKQRSAQLFGAARVLEAGYGMTEIWPFGGQFCEAGHLHFEVSQGLLEVYNGETGTAALPGEAATSPLLGKQALAVRHEQGWTYPRQVAEALEALDEVPLPARYGFWAVPGGVAVEVVVRQATPQARRRIEASLEEQGVPLADLHLLEDRRQLHHPIPLRGDLREHSFSPPLTRDLAPASEADLLSPSSHETLAGGS